LAEEFDAEEDEEGLDGRGDVEADERTTKFGEGGNRGAEFDGVEDGARVAGDAVDGVIGAGDRAEDVGAEDVEGAEDGVATRD
jgi:hypothetical protein